MSENPVVPAGSGLDELQAGDVNLPEEELVITSSSVLDLPAELDAEPAMAATAVSAIRPGWLVFYNWTGGTAPKHAGIVTAADAAHIHTVEFNTSDTNNSNGGTVARRSRPYHFVLGYIRTY